MEIHDEGLLRLFFQSTRDPGAAVAIERLAGEQIAAHEQRLAQYQALVASGLLRPGTPRRATLEAGLRLEQLMIDFWREVGAGRD
ncbi:hypothetical protein FB565_006361 [Actinoplanes lutulentus]|uniref:Virulence activator alpha n=1 Tax=Actinoplanes lutulentus TaxID=1287878 RepID=A0A327YXZ7_9ACTN|nr:hypothetical protein [Actinoplanes lutulentus]MBB2946593.1 hypothetical protein [Actinoplanes lutulentus]RAK26511.1 virulence activator alpha [Actinoplanes lutulentus]